MASVKRYSTALRYMHWLMAIFANRPAIYGLANGATGTSCKVPAYGTP